MNKKSIKWKLPFLEIGEEINMQIGLMVYIAIFIIIDIILHPILNKIDISTFFISIIYGCVIFIQITLIISTVFQILKEKIDKIKTENPIIIDKLNKRIDEITRLKEYEYSTYQENYITLGKQIDGYRKLTESLLEKIKNLSNNENGAD